MSGGRNSKMIVGLIDEGMWGRERAYSSFLSLSLNSSSGVSLAIQSGDLAKSSFSSIGSFIVNSFGRFQKESGVIPLASVLDHLMFVPSTVGFISQSVSKLPKISESV